jgi:hypothetical protein
MSFLSNLYEFFFPNVFDSSSIRVAKLLAEDVQLTLTAARPLEERLTQWQRELPAELIMAYLHPGQLNTNAALHVAFLAARTLLHRALLRPFHGAESRNPAHGTLRTSALESARAFLLFLDELRPEHLQGFWYSCA